MIKQVLKKALYFIMLLVASTGIMKAGDVILETNFQLSEGWKAQGSTAGADKTVYTQDIIYNGNTFHFNFLQGQIFPEASAIGTLCSPGYLNLNKNNSKTGIGAAGTAYFELPIFDKDVSVSFYYGSSQNADRQWVVEHSEDGGLTWMANEDDLAPMRTHGSGSVTCNYFFCPTKFVAGQKIRLTVRSTGGAIRLYSLKVEEYTPDNTPPTILSSVPVDNETEISPSIRQLSVNFSERVKGGTASIFLLSESGTTQMELSSGQLTYQDDIVTYVFPSDFRLKLNETYLFVFEKGSIRDLANNDLESTTLTFKTKEIGSSAKEILAYKIPNQVGLEVINSAAGTISVVANHDVDLLTNLNPVITLSEFAATVNDFKDFSQGPATYVVTAEDGTTKTWTVTITKNELVQATLPVHYKGTADQTWRYVVNPGWSKYIVNADRQTNVGNGIVYLMGDINNIRENGTNKAIFVENWFNPGANRISFMLRYGNVTSNYKIVVQESDNATDWTYVATFQPSNLTLAEDGVTVLSPTVDNPDPAPTIPAASSGDMLGMRSYPLKTTSQYVRMLFEVRTNSSFYFDDVLIENANDATPPAFEGVQPSQYENYSNDTKAQIFLQFSETVKPSAALIGHTTSIKINGKDYYEANILCERGGRVVLNNLEGLAHDADYTIEIPANAFVDLSDHPFAGATVQFKADLGLSSVNKVQINAAQVYVSDKTIFIKENSPVAQMEVYNTLGAKVKSATNILQLPAYDLKGVYIIRYKTQEGQLKTAKVLL